jgi:hypothetical protein
MSGWVNASWKPLRSNVMVLSDGLPGRTASTAMLLITLIVPEFPVMALYAFERELYSVFPTWR